MTRYVYDQTLVIQERDGNNVPLVTYTRGADLSGGLQRAGGIGGLLARTENQSLAVSDPGAHGFYHADAGGNITALVDSRQNVLARYRYDPFGNLLGLAGPLAEANSYRFSSKEQHAASGLYYYGYRFYEPSLQRWVNRDPIGERGGLNLYTFVGNTPLQLLDPYGLWTYLIIDTEGFLDTFGHVAIVTTNPDTGELTRLDYNHGVPALAHGHEIEDLIKPSDDIVFFFPDHNNSDWWAGQMLKQFVEENKGNKEGGSYVNNCVTSSQDIMQQAGIAAPQNHLLQRPTLVAPPPPDGRHRKGRRVVIGADIDKAPVAFEVVDAVRPRSGRLPTKCRSGLLKASRCESCRDWRRVIRKLQNIEDMIEIIARQVARWSKIEPEG